MKLRIFSIVSLSFCANIILLPFCSKGSLESSLFSLKASLQTLQEKLTHLTIMPPVRREQWVPRSQFFSDVMAITEATFQQRDRSEFIRRNDDGTMQLVNAQGEFYQAGKFEQMSINELRRQATTIQKPSINGTFNVIEAIKPLGQEYAVQVDVGAMQAHPDNKDAVFQVASNFNALELVSPNDQMDTISKYVHDKTQGPFASISAAPGLVYRHYYMFYQEGKNSIEWQQTPQRQINLLSATDIPVNNSYVDFRQKAPDAIDNYNVENMQVGYHGDVQVTFGQVEGAEHKQIDDPTQIIHQVFTAAVDFGGVNRNYENNKKALAIAQAILDAGYEGTIKSAFVHNKKKVFLTLIGGGVFKNPLSMIAQAIQRNKTFIEESGLDVTLVIYDSSRYSASGFNTFKNLMQTLVQSTGGSYVVYSPENLKGSCTIKGNEFIQKY